MTTLADVAANVADDLARSDILPQIKRKVGDVVRHLRREISYVTEQRNLVLTTTNGQTWYSALDVSSAEGLEDITAATVTADDLLSIEYARIDDDYRLCELHFSEFQRHLDGGDIGGGTPNYFTRYAGRIGLWPTPSSALDIQISAHVRPLIPTEDGDESVWFDQAQDLVEAMTAGVVARTVEHDYEKAMAFDQLATNRMANFRAESVRKMSTGRIRPRD